MIKLLKKGEYSLIETRSDTKVLKLDGKTYVWIFTKSIGEMLVATHRGHETDQKLSKGEYRVYKVENEPKLVDQLHLELAIGENDWQGYLLPTGFPKDEKTRSRIIPTSEVVTEANSIANPKVKDPRYDFHITISAHVIIENAKRQILMARRPKTWEWAPGRWGLPGGKIYQNEALVDAIKRKTKQELGFELVPEVLYQIKQLLIKDKQAAMFFFATKYKGQKLTGEMADYKWFGIEDIQAKSQREFAEFFYKKMLSDYLSKEDLSQPPKIESLNYVKLGDTEEYGEWFEGIINKDYDPNKILDYKKWEKKKKKANTG